MPALVEPAELPRARIGARFGCIGFRLYFAVMALSLTGRLNGVRTRVPVRIGPRSGRYGIRFGLLTVLFGGLSGAGSGIRTRGRSLGAH